MNELQYIDPTSPGLANLYAVIFPVNSAQVVKAADGSLIADSSVNWPAAVIALSDSAAAGRYLASVPIGLASGFYTWSVYQGSGALTDPLLSPSELFSWSGVYTPPYIPPATAPNQTTAYLITRDGQGNPLGSQTLTFALVDPEATTDAYDQTAFPVTSSAGGVLQVPLLQRTKYQARMAGGTWVGFTTGNAATFALPEVLGQYA
ncbi:MAG TPA: hypothetical protein VFC78_22080 [Tepidisphaeraceae bacterium]|nr:hypothetical protein [Tepidisphaeraceae bacterium]